MAASVALKEKNRLKVRGVRQILCILLICLLFGTMIVEGEPLYLDIKGHWAERDILKVSKLNIVSGYEGKFNPDAPITRGELAVVLNNLLNYKTESLNYFNDLDSNFYTSAILKLAAADVMRGSGEYAYPKKNITVEESFLLLGRLLKVEPTTLATATSSAVDATSTAVTTTSSGSEPDDTLSKFQDNALISSWARPMLSAMLDQGLIPLDRFSPELRPKDPITRAEFVYILNYAIPNIYVAPGEIKRTSFNSVVMVASGDVTFTNCTFQKNIFLGPGVDPETVKFNGCTKKELLVLNDGTLLNTEAEFNYPLAVFATKYNPKQTSRSHNIKTAMVALDETIIPPNSQFSYNEITGRKNASNGYKEAPVVFGGELIPGMGGGVCQVATTAFNAALLSGLQIDERHPHTLRLTYVAPGRDATVYYGKKDLKFTNNYEVPLKIKTYYNEKGSITVGIYSQGYCRIPEVVIDVSRKGNAYFTKRYVDGVLDFECKTIYQPPKPPQITTPAQIQTPEPPQKLE